MDFEEPIPFWTNEDPRLHLLSWGGEGLPLLMLHGMGGSVRWWDGVAPALAQNFKPVALDFAGHGDSGWRPDGKYGLDVYTENVESARHCLGWSKFVLVGHSMGGRVALEYAAKYPNRLIALGAFDFLSEIDSTSEGRFMRARSRSQPYYQDKAELLKHFRLQPKGTLLSETELAALGTHMVKKTPQGWTWRFDWRAFGSNYPPVWPTLAKISVPSLVMRGGHSEVMPKKDFDRVLKELRGARGVQLDNAYHHTPLDEPEKTARAIVEFASCLPSAAS